MNKNLILSNKELVSIESEEFILIEKALSTLANKTSKMAKSIKQPIEWLRQYYSVILERNLNMKQTALLLETQLAFVTMTFPADLHLMMRIGSLCWFCYSLKRCKKDL